MSLITHLQQLRALRGGKSGRQASREAAQLGESNFYLQGCTNKAFLRVLVPPFLDQSYARSQYPCSDMPMVNMLFNAVSEIKYFNQKRRVS